MKNRAFSPITIWPPVPKYDALSYSQFCIFLKSEFAGRIYPRLTEWVSDTRHYLLWRCFFSPFSRRDQTRPHGPDFPINAPPPTRRRALPPLHLQRRSIRITFAGTPATTAPGGTSRITTLFAPITARSPDGQWPNYFSALNLCNNPRQSWGMGLDLPKVLFIPMVTQEENHCILPNLSISTDYDGTQVLE